MFVEKRNRLLRPSGMIRSLQGVFVLIFVLLAGAGELVDASDALLLILLFRDPKARIILHDICQHCTAQKHLNLLFSNFVAIPESFLTIYFRRGGFSILILNFLYCATSP